MMVLRKGWLVGSMLVLSLGGCAAATEENTNSAGSGIDDGDGDAIKILRVDYQVQETSYWCGPAATRIALSARVNPPTQGTLARQLGTTTSGTDWIGQVTTVLNKNLGERWYDNVVMPNAPPTTAQRERLWTDIVTNIDKGYAVVANIVAPPNNHPPGYPDRVVKHYFTVIGYDSAGDRRVYIADPASFSGNQLYWLSLRQLSTLIPPKGYSAGPLPPPADATDANDPNTSLN